MKYLTSQWFRSNRHCPFLSDFNRIHQQPSNGAFPPWGAGRFGAGREGAVLLRSVTCRVSTTDSTLMVGGV